MVENITKQEDFSVAECPSYLLKLDLAAGRNPKIGFKSVDISSEVEPDFIVDLNKYPWPWDDNSCFELFSSHYIEHTLDIKKFMDECWRMLIPMGMITIIAPYYSSIRAWQDPTHVRPISEMTFLYYSKEWREVNKLEHYNIRSNFEILNNRYYFYPELEGKSDAAREWCRIHYLNTVMDIEVRLRAIK